MPCVELSRELIPPRAFLTISQCNDAIAPKLGGIAQKQIDGMVVEVAKAQH